MAEETKKVEVKEELNKTEPTISEDELMKAISKLTNIMKAKDMLEEEEEDKEEEEEDKEEEEEEKSVTDNFDEDETIEKAIEVSDFLKALVTQTETSIEGLAKSFDKLTKHQEKFDGEFVTSLKTLGDVIKGFDERLKKIEQTPASAGPKTILKSAVIEKSFAGGGTPEGLDALPKRKIVDLITKAVEDKKLPDNTLFSFEAGVPLKDAEADIVKSYL